MSTMVIAVVAAIIAYRQVIHARDLREDQARPFVAVSIEPSPVIHHFFNIRIQNYGSTIAKNVRISFDPPLERSKQFRNIDDKYIFKHGLSTMPPGMIVEFLLDSAISRREEKLPLRYKVTVSFEGLKGRPEEDVYDLDMEMFFGLERFNEKSVHHMFKEVERIRKNFDKWTRGGHLTVHAKDDDYRRWSDDWYIERSGRVPTLGNPHPGGVPVPTKFDHLTRKPSARVHKIEVSTRRRSRPRWVRSKE
ncbi:hypothetical protein LWF15_10850 [Kineosporia rhizophila]|uniref:hypothetical protein n=1 Tax=Kineosporia rhizophila TaxID=84633 RepID=UPI001E3684A2|nr:hypothetical protein [Kineosporia rhizophila]MCE0536009.1 hypothetical protein [Kineosporia rhizophila]